MPLLSSRRMFSSRLALPFTDDFHYAFHSFLLLFSLLHIFVIHWFSFPSPFSAFSLLLLIIAFLILLFLLAFLFILHFSFLLHVDRQRRFLPLSSLFRICPPSSLHIHIHSKGRRRKHTEA